MVVLSPGVAAVEMSVAQWMWDTDDLGHQMQCFVLLPTAASSHCQGDTAQSSLRGDGASFVNQETSIFPLHPEYEINIRM